MNDSRRHRIRTRVGLMASPLLMLLGCTHPTAVVREASRDSSTKPPIWAAVPTKLPGIPFYVKKGVCNQESVWLEPQYTLTLTTAIDDEPPTTRTLTLSRHGYESQSVQDLLKQLRNITGHYKITSINLDACPARINQRMDAVAADRTLGVVSNLDVGGKLTDAYTDGNVFLVTNLADIGVAVDYTHRDYLNTTSPWIGTAQVDAKLAADGTLNEGSVQRDDETWNVILTTVSSLVGDFTGASAASPVATTPPPQTGAAAAAPRPHPHSPCEAVGPALVPMKQVKYKYTMATSFYRHDHKRQLELDGVCAVEPGGLTDGNFTVTLQKPGDDGAKKPDKAIGFSGQVTLPKSGDEKDKKDGASK